MKNINTYIVMFALIATLGGLLCGYDTAVIAGVAESAGISAVKVTPGKQTRAELKATVNRVLLMFDDEMHLDPGKELRLALA